MRIKIVFTPLTEPSFMPLDQHALADLLYRTVGLVAPDYATFLHDEGYSAPPPAAGKAHKTFKLFTFSRPFLPDTLLNKGLEDRAWFARGNVVWQVSSPLVEFIEAVTVGLISQQVVTLGDARGDTQFAVESIEEMLPPPLGEQMRFTTLSPITVAVTETDANGQRRKQFLWADDPRFGPLVVANLQEKYRALTGAEPSGELRFAFDEAYIERRGGVRKVSKLVPYKGTNIRAWQAPFTVTGDPALIRLGWEAGFGQANSKGFGMAEAAPSRK
jgi:CRISPR-associated endoribonuclease Cas6